jgi:hypothetical protein
MNMNPLIINIVVLEKKLEIQRQRHLRRDGLECVEPTLRPRRKKLKWTSGRLRRRQACESS